MGLEPVTEVRDEVAHRVARRKAETAVARQTHRFERGGEPFEVETSRVASRDLREGFGDELGAHPAGGAKATAFVRKETREVVDDRDWVAADVENHHGAVTGKCFERERPRQLLRGGR